MQRNEKAIQTLEKQLHFAERASIVLKNPSTVELFRWMSDDIDTYLNQIVKTTPLTHEEYLLTLGKLQGLRNFINKVKTAAANKEVYAEQLSKYKQ